MTREDLARFRTLKINYSAIGLEQGAYEPCFCTPADAEYIGSLGCDGVHFILLPGDERVFCVEPALGEPGTYVLPVAEDFRAFLSYILYCRDANPIAQLAWMEEEAFRSFLEAEREAAGTGDKELLEQKQAALAAIAAQFALAPEDPYERVKALQAGFDPRDLHFSEEYYDVLGIEREIRR